LSGIHDFNPGETFCKGTFSTSRGEVYIRTDMLLIWKGQFAYPDYRYLKEGKELSSSERGGDVFGKDVFGKDYEEVASKILTICESKRDKLSKIVNQLKGDEA